MIKHNNHPYALITGASSGIGLEYAILLAQKGYHLLLVSNQDKELTDLANTLSDQYSVQALPYPVDLSDNQAAYRLLEYTERENIRIEVLINNAGIFRFNPLTSLSTDLITQMIQLHILTPTLLCRLFGEKMQQQKQGYILNMSSLSAWMSFPGISLYESTKAYLRTFSKALHHELYNSGVIVTTVCPGAVATELYHLKPQYQRWAIRLSIMMTPRQLAQKGLKALFKGQQQLIPGTINRIFLLLLPLFPSRLTRYIVSQSKWF